jgi:hypothetical protein
MAGAGWRARRRQVILASRKHKLDDDKLDDGTRDDYKRAS